jgi:hypothetical protein
MSDSLAELAADLAHAAHAGAAEAGAGAVHAGTYQAEVGMRTFAKGAGVAVAGAGGLRALVGVTQRRGVYQEAAPATAVNVNTGAVAETMAETAAAIGVREVTG